MVSSTESAITSRDGSEALHAGMAHGDAVGHGDGAELARRAAGIAATPFLTAWAWRISAMLQGAASFQQVATPTKGGMDLFGRQTHRVIKGAMRRAFRPLGGVPARQFGFQIVSSRP